MGSFATGNGGTAEEGIERTYASVDGCCPLADYLGSNGFCLELALRQEVQRLACATDLHQERVILLVQRLSAAGHDTNKNAQSPAWLDSGVDSAAPMRSIEACNQTLLPQVDWLNKWNPRSVETAGPLARLDADSNTR